MVSSLGPEAFLPHRLHQMKSAPPHPAPCLRSRWYYAVQHRLRQLLQLLGGCCAQAPMMMVHLSCLCHWHRMLRLSALTAPAFYHYHAAAAAAADSSLAADSMALPSRCRLASPWATLSSPVCCGMVNLYASIGCVNMMTICHFVHADSGGYFGHYDCGHGYDAWHGYGFGCALHYGVHLDLLRGYGEQGCGQKGCGHLCYDHLGCGRLGYAGPGSDHPGYLHWGCGDLDCDHCDCGRLVLPGWHSLTARSHQEIACPHAEPVEARGVYLGLHRWYHAQTGAVI
mmetsp:Transcript_34833/g.92031  ORF Transcript_34833/g.92031 Transcript_34833/m.92031 type:complete len:284 (+) Transcript_34833:747-1598(+)